MGMKLYGMSLSYNTLRSTAALNEKGLDFEFSLVDLRSGAHKQPPFLALNPFGQIPVLEDGDTILFESRAINRYIATKYKETGLDLLPADISSAAAVEVWLEVESHQFGNPAGDLVFQLLVLPMVGGTTDQAVVEKQSEKLAKVLDVYEARLGENKYLAGGEFTLVDLNHLPCMYLLLKTSKADLIAARPHVNAWFEDISSRPAWKKTAAGIPL